MLCTEGTQDDTRKILDSVASAYLNEVVFADGQSRLVLRDAVAKAAAKAKSDLQPKIEALDLAIKEASKDCIRATVCQVEIDVGIENWRKALSLLTELDVEADSPSRTFQLQPAKVSRQ